MFSFFTTDAFVKTLNKVNSTYNWQIAYVADGAGQDKLTASVDLLAGDCEDYAGSKGLFLIKNKIVKPEELRPLLVYDTFYKKYHMVLIVKDKYVLDNMKDKVYTLDKIINGKTVYTLDTTSTDVMAVQHKYSKQFKELFTSL